MRVPLKGCIRLLSGFLLRVIPAIYKGLGFLRVSGFRIVGCSIRRVGVLVFG